MLSGYFHPKVIAVMFLGFSSGLPRLLVASTLGAWLSDSGVEKAAIGLFAYVSLPYAFNFVWAPLLDHIRLPFLAQKLGHRVSWILLIQLCLLICLLAMGGINPSNEPYLVALVALLIAFFSASQDVLIDAYRTEFLDKSQYGEGAAVAVFGYRVGMLVAGAGALAFADITNWQYVYPFMAIFMLVGMITALIAGEPAITRKARTENQTLSEWLKQAILEPFMMFAKTHHNWFWLLLLVACYRMPDGFIGFMATPFLLDIGFSKTEIAQIGKIYGFAATIAGTFIGGWFTSKYGLWKALFIFGIAQIITNLAYMLVASVGPQTWALMLAITCDNLAGGAVTAAAIVLLMRLCDTRYTATQYALLASLASLASILLAGGAGWVAEEYGWKAMFALSSVMGIPAMILLIKMRQINLFKRSALQKL